MDEIDAEIAVKEAVPPLIVALYRPFAPYRRGDILIFDN